MDEIIKKLEDFGINENMAKIYTFMLREQDLPVYKIAQGVRIPRTTTYLLLEELEAQGLASSWKKNNVKHYSAENPENLKRILSDKQRALDDVFGDLSDMFKLERDNPKTKVMIGKDGVRLAFEQILEIMLRDKTKRVYGIFETQLTEVFPDFFLEWRERKNKKTGATTFLIVPKGSGSHEHYKTDPYRITREMPDSNPLGGSLNIIGSTIFFYSFKKDEIYSIIIESKIISGMLIKLFMHIWNSIDPKDGSPNLDVALSDVEQN